MSGWADNHIARLQLGEAVTFCPRGRSMEPRVHDGQRVTVAPARGRDIKPGDVVLCTVRGRQYLHVVRAVEGDNGWTRRIHGVLVDDE